MKQIFTVYVAIGLIFLLSGCNKQNVDQPQDYQFTLTTYVNPTDPTLLLVTYEDGTTVTYTGTKDANGIPVKIEHVSVTYPDVAGTFLVSLDDNMLPVSELTPNGTVFEFVWNADSTLRLTAISPDGEVQVSIPIDPAGLKSLQPEWQDGTPENVRAGIPAQLSFKPYQPGETAPVKALLDNQMIFHVKKCGVDVDNATVVLNVQPALGVNSFPCSYSGNGFYATQIPKSGEPPANYEQTCDKVGTLVKDVCALYNLASLFGSNVAGQVCQLLSSEIAKAFPGSVSGAQVNAMCTKGMGAIAAICKLAEKQDIAELCKLSFLLNSEPKGGYTFTVTVNVPGRPPFTPASQPFDPNNPQTYLVDMGGTFDILNLRVNPPDPAPLQGYTAYADILCPDPGGTSVTISVLGSDNYSDSRTETFTQNGQISLVVPGGAQSVQDVITVTGGGKTLNISIVF